MCIFIGGFGAKNLTKNLTAPDGADTGITVTTHHQVGGFVKRKAADKWKRFPIFNVLAVVGLVMMSHSHAGVATCRTARGAERR